MRKIAGNRNYELMKVAEEDCSSVHDDAINKAIVVVHDYLNPLKTDPLVQELFSVGDHSLPARLRNELTARLVALHLDQQKGRPKSE